MKIVIILLAIPLLSLGQSDQIMQIKNSFDQKNYDKALVLIQQAIDQRQETNLVYYYKAFSEDNKKMIDSAIFSASKALSMTAKSDTLYLDILAIRADAYFKNRMIHEAIADNEMLLVYSPDNLDYLLNMSFLYSENGQLYNSLKTLQHALYLDSSNVYILNNLAYDNCEAEDYKSAIKYAERGLTLTNDSTWRAALLNSLGFAQAKSGSLESGLKTINRSLGYNPNNPYAYFNIGRIYMDEGDRSKACYYLKKAKELGGIIMTSEYLKLCE